MSTPFKLKGWSPFAQKPKGKLTKKQKEELEAKGAELSPPDRYDAHNTNARKMECADKGGKWVEVSPGKFECK